MNYDTSTYEFEDIDLKQAVKKLPERDAQVVLYYLMGFKQREIAPLFDLSRSMICKILHKAIMRIRMIYHVD